MAVDSHLEYSMVLLGWFISGKIWAVLVDSGAVALPFFFMIIDNFVETRRQGTDEGNKGVLAQNNLEVDLAQAMILIVVSLVPLHDVNLKVIYPPNADNLHAAQCSMSDQGTPSGDESAWTSTFSSVNGMSAQVPFWWEIWHMMSAMITYPAIAAIPCEVNLRQVKYELNQEYISGGLAAELADFARDCYAVSKSRLTNLKRSDYYQFSEAQLRDVDWIGSNYFLTTPGYYDTHHASLPNPHFPYDAARDVALPNTGNGGYPTCKQWWSDGTVGLATRAKAELTSDLLKQLYAIGATDEDLLRTLVSSSEMDRPGRVYRNYGYSDSTGQGVKTSTAGLGMFVAQGAIFPAMYLVQVALPMVQGMLLLALIIAVPLIMTMGSFSFPTLMSLSFAYFSLFFMTFWWELARFIDNKWLTILYGGPGSGVTLTSPSTFLSNSYDDAVSNFVTVSMFLILPAFFTSAMVWAGYRVGVISDSLGTGAERAGKAGGSGGDAMKKAAGGLRG